MKKFIPLLLAVFAVTLASCEKDPDMDKLDNNYLVYTNYDKKADFKTFATYYMPDSMKNASFEISALKNAMISITDNDGISFEGITFENLKKASDYMYKIKKLKSINI